MPNNSVLMIISVNIHFVNYKNCYTIIVIFPNYTSLTSFLTDLIATLLNMYESEYTNALHYMKRTSQL